MVEVNLRGSVSQDRLKTAVDFYRQSHGGQRALFESSEGSVTHPFKYALYVFSCEPRHEDVEQYSMQKLGRVPNWVLSAKHAHEVYYVGTTTNLERRLEQHIEGGNEASIVTKLFEPVTLTRLDFESDWQQIKDLELSHADRLRELDGVFVPYEVIK